MLFIDMNYFHQITGFLLLWFVIGTHCQVAKFGDNIDSVDVGGDVISRNTDKRFSDMGQVTKEVFDVSAGQVTLTLNVQDTENIKEFWIIDFEPYRYNVDQLPVNEATGGIVAANTGPCSNVFEDQDFDTYMADDYFQDRTTEQLAVNKNLFTSFERGTLDGENSTRRNNKIHFTGDMGSWFDCTESDGQTKVWQLTSNADNTDELEYRTKVYAINVRPKDDDDALGGISFVQSHIELIWRLSRTGISTLIVSSTALLQPVLEFARVSAVYDDQGDAIPTQAGLHLRFHTVVDSDQQMVTYVAQSITYTPDSDALAHGLRSITFEPPTALADSPECEFILDVGTGLSLQCNQVWDFKVILTIDINGHEENRSPVDASGVFEFDFNQYSCVTNNAFDKDACISIDDEPAKVAALITIQTVVFVQDEEDDQVNIMLVALKGADNQELSVAGSRGIAHKESITLEVKFSPAVLRADYKLDLLLFMVCRGEEYSTDQYPHGCLEAPSVDRYVAHRLESFSYTPRISNSSGVFEDDPYTYSHIEDDFFQDLAFEGYVENDEFNRPLPVPVHRSTFLNLALSGASEKYVITNIYQLTENSRRKRQAKREIVIAKTVMQNNDALSFFHGHSVFKSRYTRDIDDSVDQSQSQRYQYSSLGCPAGASHNDRDCHCPAETVYSTRTFQCEIETVVNDNEIIGVIEVRDQDQENEANDLESDTNDSESGVDGCKSSSAVLVAMIMGSLFWLFTIKTT